MTDLKSTERLADPVTRLRSAVRMQPLDESALKHAVCVFVDETKSLGWPVERVIVEVKRVAEVEDGTIYTRLVGGAENRLYAQQLISHLVSHCVKHYYQTGSVK